MEVIRWAELAEYLRTGREIEFAYGGKQYSITNAKGSWNFYCDTDGTPVLQLCGVEERERLVERAAGVEIGGRSLPEIFDRLLYEQDLLCIL